MGLVQALRDRLGAPYTVRWLALYSAARLTAWSIAVALMLWGGIARLGAILLLYGPLSTAAPAVSSRLGRSPVAWAVDIARDPRAIAVRIDADSQHVRLHIADDGRGTAIDLDVPLDQNGVPT
jgi:hypothetical protein